MNSEETLKILVVDDDPAITRTICSFLKLSGYQCNDESDPLVALRRAQDDDYHLIITDLVMPNLDGLEMVREL